MKNKKIIIIVEIIGITLGLFALGFGLYILLTPKKETLKYDDAVALSKQIKENKTKLEKTLKEVNKNKELTQEEKIKQEIEEEKKSDAFKEYEELTEEKKEEIDAIPREEEVPIEKLDEIIEEQKTDEVKEIPSKFTLANKINMKVENQEFRSLCWAFASLNSVETFIALHYGEDYDFSEQHVNYITSNLLYGNREIDQGGNFEMFEKYLAQSGVVLEKNVPYDRNYNENEYSKFIDMKPVKVITNTVDFPSIYKAWYDTSEEDLNKFRETVKRHIMTNGSIYASISAYGNDMFSDDNRFYYVSKENPRMLYSDHAISIVGWDDSIPKEKFSDNGNIPEHDGAYIAFNSWGNYYYESITSEMGPYFYISYDDIYVETSMSGVTSAEFDDKSVVDINSLKSPAIKEYITQHYNYAIKEENNKKYISKSILDDIYYLELNNAEIDLKELELFPSLSYLSITNSKITSIEDLPKIEQLSSIKLSNNQIENIDKLSEYSNLKNIVVNNNNIKDVSNLKGLELYDLDLSNNPGVKGYSSINSVERLILENNNLNQLEEINYNLISLDIDNNEFEQIPSQISSLVYLSIQNNKLTDLTGIEALTNLYSLNISKNSINDLSIPNEKISELIYNDSTIQDITQLNNLSSLRYITLKNDNITSLEGFNPSYKLSQLDISGNKGITGYGNIPTYTLLINDCNITEIEELNEQIKTLYANNNSISNINNLSNSSIEYINIENNKETITGTFDATKIKYASLINSNTSEDLEIISNNTSYVRTNNYNTCEKIMNSDTKCILENIELTDDIINQPSISNVAYISNAKLNIDVDVSNNKIDITKYPALKTLYRIDQYFDDKDVIISRDRKTITVKDNTKNISTDYNTININGIEAYGTVNMNLQRKNSLLNGIMNAFN